jgi:DNA primase
MKFQQLCATVIASAFFTAHISPADPPAEGPNKSIDDALLEDLDNELLDGIEELPKERKTPQEKSQVAKPDMPPDEMRESEVADTDNPEGPDPAKDPLGYISQEMRNVEQLIPELKKQPHAQALQQQILENLAKLIEQAEQQQSQQQQSSQQSKQEQQTAARQKIKQPAQQAGKPGSGQASQSPAQDSSTRVGTAEPVRPDPELLRGLMKDAWGHLPERQREQMRQSAPEKFVPQYELLIERYYRRLAEERSP